MVAVKTWLLEHLNVQMYDNVKGKSCQTSQWCDGVASGGDEELAAALFGCRLLN